jgi:hypothetical protein
MFVSTFALAAVMSGDPAPAKATPRFEISRLYQWMFAKRPTPPKEAPAPIPEKAEDDLSDARIELRCRNAVFSEPALRASGMTVRVTGGVAYLEGAASSRWLRIRAEQLAGKTPGVIRVENNLRISDEMATPPPPTVDLPDVKQPASTPTPTSWEVLASRPKALAGEEGQPVVTTYAIRRPREGSSTLKPTSAQAAAPTKPGAGKLIPWDESQPLLIPAGEPIPRAIPKRERAEDPIDASIMRILSESPSAKGLSFERNGREIALKGAAPAHVLFSVAQRIGALDGVATVTLESP